MEQLQKEGRKLISAWLLLFDKKAECFILKDGWIRVFALRLPVIQHVMSCITCNEEIETEFLGASC